MVWVLIISGFAMALVAGVFLGFSDFIMRGLAQAPANKGAAGMVGLNRTVYRSIFMVLLMGMVPVALALCFVALWLDGAIPKMLIMTCGTAYLSGVLLVTGAGNVPIKTRLDAMATATQDTAVYWPE